MYALDSAYIQFTQFFIFFFKKAGQNLEVSKTIINFAPINLLFILIPNHLYEKAFLILLATD